MTRAPLQPEGIGGFSRLTPGAVSVKGQGHVLQLLSRRGDPDRRPQREPFRTTAAHCVPRCFLGRPESRCVAVQSITAASILRDRPLRLTVHSTSTYRSGSPVKSHPAPRQHHVHSNTSTSGRCRSKGGPIPVEPIPKPTATQSRYGGAGRLP